tara:strand:- start:1559 stop:1945 length:387 start_codon:yes stop_codon:yes gene_type:complete
MEQTMKSLKLRENSGIDLSVKNLISIVIAVAISVWAYFGIIERINKLETSKELMSADLLKKADQTPKNLEMYMLIEHNAGLLEKHQAQLDENVHTKVLLLEAEKKILKLEEDVEDLKNKFRKANGSNH